MAQFTRTSTLSGVERTVELPITQEAWDQHKRDCTLIQEAFPHLSPDQREFLMTGVTADEWDKLFDDEDGCPND